ncbi:hypothetical protein Hanom_Chr15g01376551 [Helianthus anomalus]
MATDHGSKNTIFSFLTCVIFLVSVILIKINHCEGSLLSSKRCADMCNGTVAKCPTLVEDDEEFLMDTEEHRWILGGKPTGHLSYGGLKNTKTACHTNVHEFIMLSIGSALRLITVTSLAWIHCFEVIWVFVSCDKKYLNFLP